MRTLVRNKQKIWLAPRLGTKDMGFEGSVEFFAEPRMIWANVQPLSGYSDRQSYGERANSMRRIDITTDVAYLFNEMDKMYIGTTPDGEEVHGQNANFRVVAIRPWINDAAVFVDRIDGMR